MSTHIPFSVTILCTLIWGFYIHYVNISGYICTPSVTICCKLIWGSYSNLLSSMGTHVPFQSQSVVHSSGDCISIMLTSVDTFLNQSVVHSSDNSASNLSLHSSDVFNKHPVDHRHSQLSIMNSNRSLFTLPITQVLGVHVQYLPKHHPV